jgi:hypothetical protein
MNIRISDINVPLLSSESCHDVTSSCNFTDALDHSRMNSEIQTSAEALDTPKMISLNSYHQSSKSNGANHCDDFAEALDFSKMISHGTNPFNKFADVSIPIHVARTKTIPPFSQIILSGKLIDEGVNSESDMIIEPINFHTHVIMAHTIVKPDNGLVPLLFLNQSSQSITLWEGQHIGNAEPVATKPMHQINAIQSSSSPAPKHAQLPPVNIDKENLTPLQLKQLESLFTEFSDIFSANGRIG